MSGSLAPLRSPRLRIGLCYELKVEYIAQGLDPEKLGGYEELITIQAIIAALEKGGFEVVDIGNLKRLVRALVETDGSLGCDLVFNIHCGVHGLARESQVPALLEAYQIPFTLSNAATMVWCLDKSKTKMVLESSGIPTAPFAVIPATSHGDSFEASLERFEKARNTSRHAKSLHNFPLFLKPAGECSSIGIQPSNKVHTATALVEEIERLSSHFPNSDILVETFLSGREFTVGIIGTGNTARIIGFAEFIYHTPAASTSLPDFYTNAHKEADVYVDMTSKVAETRDPVVQAVARTALNAWRTLNCFDGGRVDMRLDSHLAGAVPHVIEMRPLPGLRPGISDLPLLAAAAGIRYDELVLMIVDAALERYGIDRGTRGLEAGGVGTGNLPGLRGLKG